MEGRHFAAGPWFAVQQENDWGKIGTLFISNGKHSMPGKVEIQMALAGPDKTVWEEVTTK